MFKKSSPQIQRIDAAIDDVLSQMKEQSAATVQYAKMNEQLAKLYELRTRIAGANSISPETLATISAHLIGIGMILHHERAHVITTKALGFVSKLR